MGAAPPQLDARGAAKTMVALMIGMRVLSRSAACADDLRAVRDQAMALLKT